MPQLEEASKSPSEEVAFETGGQEYPYGHRGYDSPWPDSPSSHGGRSGRPPSQISDNAEIEHARSDELSDESDSIASPEGTPPPKPQPEPGWAVHPFGGKRAPIIRSKDDPVVEETSPTASERARWREIDEPDTQRERCLSREDQERLDALYERGWSSPIEQSPRNEYATRQWRPNQEIVKDVPENHRVDPNLSEALVLKVPDYQGTPEPPMKLEDMPKAVRFWFTTKDDEVEEAERQREIKERWKNSEMVQAAAGRPKARIKRLKAVIQEEVRVWRQQANQAQAGDLAVVIPEVTTGKVASPVANEPAETTNPWAGRLRKRPPKPPNDEEKPPARRRKKDTGGATASEPRPRARRTRVKRSENRPTPIPPASPPCPPSPPQKPDGTALHPTRRSLTSSILPPLQIPSGEPPTTPYNPQVPSPLPPPFLPPDEALNPTLQSEARGSQDRIRGVECVPNSPRYSLSPSPPPSPPLLPPCQPANPDVRNSGNNSIPVSQHQETWNDWRSPRYSLSPTPPPLIQTHPPSNQPSDNNNTSRPASKDSSSTREKKNEPEPEPEPPNSPRYSLSPSPPSLPPPQPPAFQPSQLANLDPETYHTSFPVEVPTSPRYYLSPSPPPPSTRPSSPECRLSSERQIPVPTSPRYSLSPSLSPPLSLDLDLGSSSGSGSNASGSPAPHADGVGRRDDRGYWEWKERREVYVRAKRRREDEDEGFEVEVPRVRRRSW
ncbi:MAG: hypothetical protein Q9167_004451 [Letrouitia subvulpina]